MKIVSTGIAGTLESSDVMITVRENSAQKIEIRLESVVEAQFGKQIRRVVEEKLKCLGVDSADVYINDKGALDSTIEARLLAALYRAAGLQTYAWEVI